MGLSDRWRTPPATPWAPPAAGSCRCKEHLENLYEHEIPYGVLTDEPGGMSVGDLVECEALEARAVEPDDAWHTIARTGQRVGPFHWSLWLGDEARALYDDAAPASLDDVLSVQPGIERVAWDDREVFLVGAPTLCASGVMAAMVRALDNPRVRLG